MSVLCEYAAYFARCRIFAYFSKVRISQFFLHKLAFLTAILIILIYCVFLFESIYDDCA